MRGSGPLLKPPNVFKGTPAGLIKSYQNFGRFRLGKKNESSSISTDYTQPSHESGMMNSSEENLGIKTWILCAPLVSKPVPIPSI